MKLAEALRLRKDYDEKRRGLQQRINSNCKVQEGDEPAEDPWSLVRQYEHISMKLMQLVTKINEVNSVSMLEYASSLDNTAENSTGDVNSHLVPVSLKLSSRTMAFALAERTVLKNKINMYEQMADAADVSDKFQYSKSEIKIKSAVDVKAVQRRIDNNSKLMRMLDTKIQEMNWTIEVDIDSKHESGAT